MNRRNSLRTGAASFLDQLAKPQRPHSSREYRRSKLENIRDVSLMADECSHLLELWVILECRKKAKMPFTAMIYKGRLSKWTKP